VPDTVLVCANKLRKWKFHNMQSISVSSVESCCCDSVISSHSFLHFQYAVKRKAVGMQGLWEGQGRWGLLVTVATCLRYSSHS
ncbi:hypothetical protein BHE74_00050447, partial [Ensete ventricosum]